MLDAGASQADAADGVDVDDDPANAASSPPIRCASCRHPVARDDERIDPDGRGHRQVHANPSGFVFELWLFERALGVVPRGAPSLHFTWFAGCAWTVVVCVGCATHLGWHFADETRDFVGLIFERVVQ